MGNQSFQKKKEDFVCLACGVTVAGDGYTNHCPSCLASRHVDVFPGDREADCGGLMDPVAYSVKNGEERILHRCVLCGHEKENRVHEADDRDAVLALITRQADRFAKESGKPTNS